MYKQIKASKIKISNIDDYEKFVESIKPEKEYADYLKDKRVVIVGPSKYLLDSELADHGKVIDDYDVIIRIKCIDYFHKIHKREKFVGNRTDVIYNWKNFHAEKSDTKIPDLLKHNVKHFRVPKGEKLTKKDIEKYGKKRSDHFPAHNIKSCKHVVFDSSGYEAYCESLVPKPEIFRKWPGYGPWHPQRRSELQTGTAGIMELIASDCKELYITGVTYYHGGDNMFQQKKDSHANPIYGKHNGAVEIRLLVDALLYEIEKRGNLNRIKVDNVLKFVILKYVNLFQEIEKLEPEDLKGKGFARYLEDAANSIKESALNKFGPPPTGMENLSDTTLAKVVANINAEERQK
tara:strand:- start:1621 stop:2664 length:1044 start_codon:yes stop_codon:yes gene_type:complete